MIYSIDVLMIFSVATHRMATSKSLGDVDFELVLRHHHAEIAVAQRGYEPVLRSDARFL